MHALDDGATLPPGIGYRTHARFVPPLDHPAMVSIIGRSGWRTARRMAADLSLGGVSVWLSPSESSRTVVGEPVTVELELDGEKLLLRGVAAQVHARPGSFWMRKCLGVAFEDGTDLAEVETYLKRIRAVGARLAQ